MYLNKRLALYTTIYPAAEKFFSEFVRSACEQTDGDFDLWVGLDGCSINWVIDLVGGKLRTHFVPSEPGDTPATLREHALLEICSNYDYVVLVDSDDILLPTRVAAARESLKECDLSGCALEIIDERGKNMGICIGPQPGTSADNFLPATNVFGFTNTSWRTEQLLRLFPLPIDCVLVDWMLATKAWGLGMRICCDTVPHMLYRQYEGNIARVVPPFSERQIVQAAELVVNHFQIILRNADDFIPDRLNKLKRAASHVDKFYKMISVNSAVLIAYTSRLNNMPPGTAWWSFLAHSHLEAIWNL